MRSQPAPWSPTQLSRRATAGTGREIRTPADPWLSSGPRARRTSKRCSCGRPGTACRSCRAAPAAGCPAGRARSTAASCSASSGCARSRSTPPRRVAVVEPGALNVEVKQAAAAEHGLWYPPDPSLVRDLLDRRQRRHQRRRPVLREVRRHHRLRARPRRRARRRHPRAPRRQAGQGRRRAVAAQALRRQRGHPRHRHPGDPAAGPGPAAARPRSSRPSRRSRPRPARSSAIGRTLRAVDARADGPGVDQRRRGLPRDGPRPRRRRAAARPVRRARRRPRRRDRRDGAGLRGGRRRGGASRPTTRTRASCSSRPGGRPSPRSRRWATLLLEDVGVPVPALPALVRGVERIAAARDTRSPSSPTPATATPTRSSSTTRPIRMPTRAPSWPSTRSWPRASLGGTITGEHGVGRLKKAWLPG